MAEITPILPSTNVIGVSKVERDEARKKRPQKQPLPDQKNKAEPSAVDQQSGPHIDERV